VHALALAHAADGYVGLRFVPTKPRHVFGTEQRIVLGENITVSAPERTALDCLKYGIGTFAFAEFTAIVVRVLRCGQSERLAGYIHRFKSGPLACRLGVLATLTKVDLAPALLDALRSFPIPATPIWLDRLRPATSSDSIDRTRGVRLNATLSDLFRI